MLPNRRMVTLARIVKAAGPVIGPLLFLSSIAPRAHLRNSSMSSFRI
jgi:hypothetical protein